MKSYDIKMWEWMKTMEYQYAILRSNMQKNQKHGAFLLHRAFFGDLTAVYRDALYIARTSALVKG